MGSCSAVALAVRRSLLTPVVRMLAIRFGAVVAPSADARHVHTRPTPTLGGAAMFVGFLAAMAVASHMGQFHEMFQDNSEPFGVILAAGVMFMVGALDDLIDVSPPAKVAGQVRRGEPARALRRLDVLLPDAVQPLPHRRRRARRSDWRRSSPRCGSC